MLPRIGPVMCGIHICLLGQFRESTGWFSGNVQGTPKFTTKKLRPA